jgi:NTE family protein
VSDVLETRLRAVPFFRNLDGPSLAAIAARLRLEAFEAGTVIFAKGDPAETMYLVESGTVDVLAGPAAEPLASLGPGSFVGELGLLLDEPRSASLQAATDSQLWVLARTDLEGLLSTHPAVAVELSRELGRRLVATSRRVAPPAVTRFTAVWGPGVGTLARALADLGEGRIGVARLAGSGTGAGDAAGAGVVELDSSGFENAEAVAALAGQEVERCARVLFVLPPVPGGIARAALALADHVVALADAPGWVGAGRRLLRGHGPPGTLERAARWVAGRAVGVAFSSGGSKSVAHVGVLRVLLEEGVPIDAVAGTSGGALAAVGLALGQSADEMLVGLRELTRHTTWRRFDFNLLPRSAVLKGERLHRLFHAYYSGRTFADTLIPCWVVAADVHTGEEVVIGEGPVADGIRASMSIPGAFNPWRVGGRLLMDGAVVNPMPANVLRDAGLRLVIGSNVAAQRTPLSPRELARVPHLLQIMSRMVGSMEQEMIKAQLPLADVVVRPVVTTAGSFDFSRMDELVAEGERAARQAVPEIRRVLPLPSPGG